MSANEGHLYFLQRIARKMMSYFFAISKTDDLKGARFRFWKGHTCFYGDWSVCVLPPWSSIQREKIFVKILARPYFLLHCFRPFPPSTQPKAKGRKDYFPLDIIVVLVCQSLSTKHVFFHSLTHCH
jgi:hypothetical protein